MANPGFPVGEGMDPLAGRGPPTQVLFAENDAKMKELGPVGLRAPGTPPKILQ